MKPLASALLLASLAAVSCTGNSGDAHTKSGRRTGPDINSTVTPRVADAGAEDVPDIEHGELVGTWRMALDSPGGPIPVALEIYEAGHAPAAVFRNGEEAAPASEIAIKGASVTMQVAPFDAVLVGRVNEARTVMLGKWRKTVPGGVARLDFHAVKGATHRFEPEPGQRRDAPESIAGTWLAEFVKEGSKIPGVGEFTQEGQRVTGTFLTPAGDMRFLEGDYSEGRLRLSSFDGAHGFLLVGTVEPDGTLIGDTWDVEGPQWKWSARRGGGGAAERALPNPFAEVRVTSPDGRIQFQFPNLVGKPVSLSDRRFFGKVVVVEVFGSWCPNCNDAAPLLAEWYRRYRDRGLEIVGLAFEHSGDPRRDREVLRAYKARYGIEFPLLVAGTSDMKTASNSLRGLTELKAYPTTLFIDRTGRVRRIHSGFSGPGTGEHHKQLVSTFERTIEALLDEPAPSRR